MSILLLVTIILLCVNEVISNCPPNSGIYLMFNGDCYPNSSYIYHIYITKDHANYSPLKCALPNTTLSGGEWVDPNGNTLSCNTNPLYCDKTNNPASISLYRPNGGISFNEADGNDNNNTFKCCLPSSCSDPTTSMITVNIFKHVAILNFIIVELPSNITVLPQQYTLQCILSGLEKNFGWYYINTNNKFNCVSPHFGYSCSIENQTLYSINNTIVRNLTVTWYAEEINSGIFSQSNNNGDHTHLCFERVSEIHRHRYLTVTAPGFTPSPPILVNKTSTTITIRWITVPSDADGYVVNATSDTHTVTQQVEGGSQNVMTLKELMPTTTYSITVRAYQDILGPASDTTSVQTLFSAILSVNWTFISSITKLQNTQYHINCMTTTVNVTTDVYWLVNGVIKYNSMYTLIDSDLFIYNNTLLVYSDPLGVSVNITCIAMYKGVKYSDTVILQVPSGPPSNVMAYILNETSIKVNWTMSSQTNGYVIVINSITGVGTNKILSTTEHEVIINGLTLSTYYNIRVYSYKDLPSINRTQTLLKFDVPTPVTSLSVTDVSTTTITVNWTSPSSKNGNYVTYYNISYSPFCPPVLSVNMTSVYVIPYQLNTIFSYILKELSSGMNYTITVRAGNVLGESNPVLIFGETKPTSGPSGSPKSIMALSINLISNKIIWEDIDCHLRNGRIIEYIVIISNNSITYNLTSTERYIIVNDLVFGNVYNVSVAGVNSIGRGPFSDLIEVQIGTVPGPVSTLTSLMSNTWAVISWSVPSYIPVEYPIITYEIGYTTRQSNCGCSLNDEFNPMIKTNTSSRNVTIRDLVANTCYLFGVRGYTVNGYGAWTVIANQTLVESLTTDPTLCTESCKSSITGLGVLVGILLSVVIACSIANVLQFIHIRRLVVTSSKDQQQKESQPDEDIEMKVCEPYSLHQSKLTDESKVIYDECQLSTTDIAATSVYESI